MKRSLWVDLISGDKTETDKAESVGDVMIVVRITANMANRVVRRSGKRIAELI